MNCFTFFVEQNIESEINIGFITTITGVRTSVETEGELQEKFNETLALCLEEMDAMR